jgi:hypothetical protein
MNHKTPIFIAAAIGLFILTTSISVNSAIARNTLESEYFGGMGNGGHGGMGFGGMRYGGMGYGGAGPVIQEQVDTGNPHLDKSDFTRRINRQGKLPNLRTFRDIGAITNRVKLEVERERGQLEEEDDIKSKSKTTQGIKLFSELESPVEVAIALDLPTDQVQAIYREYWKLEGMYGLAQIYEEAKYDIHDLLRLHKIAKDLGMEKQDIINVLTLGIVSPSIPSYYKF